MTGRFLPDGAAAVAVDAAMHAALADSIATVLAPLQAQAAIAAAAAADIVDAMRSGVAGPGAVGAYVDLVEAIHRDAADDAVAALDALAAAARRLAAGLRCVTLADDDLGVGQADRYERILSDDPTTPIRVLPVDTETKARLAARVGEGLALLDAGAPEAAAEVRALAREIVIVASAGGTSIEFAGAATVHLWGAIFLNAGSHRTRLGMAEALVHECAHALLFGRAMGGRLVEGPDEGRHASPLRDDPRPMDGLVHATFVLARMAWCMRALQDAGVLDPAEAAAARAAEAHHRRLFEDGWQEVAAHARLTPVGAAAMAGARAWIDSTA